MLHFTVLASLLVWNFMQHVMHEHLKHTDTTIPGWDGKATQTMTTKLKGVLVAEFDGEWCFTKALSSTQMQYIRALSLTEDLSLRRDGTGKRRDQKIPCEKA